jgi:hypothetical protein
MTFKSGQHLQRYFPEIVAGALSLKATSFVLDGEIVVPVETQVFFRRPSAAHRVADARNFDERSRGDNAVKRLVQGGKAVGGAKISLCTIRVAPCSEVLCAYSRRRFATVLTSVFGIASKRPSGSPWRVARIIVQSSPGVLSPEH